MKPRSFIIGDVHGHWARLYYLLGRAQVLQANMETGVIELVPDVEVIQLGDLGHFDAESKENDYRAYEMAKVLGIKVLWGNHDRAVIDWNHGFRGYAWPGDEMRELMGEVAPMLALVRHGYLITHAGLSGTHGRMVMLDQLQMVAGYLNEYQGDRNPIIDDIARLRGGFSEEGGILWRDERESLAPVPQIFGHTRADRVRQWNVGGHKQWCIDTGAKHNETLTGIMLPEERIISVGPDADMIERVVDEL